MRNILLILGLMLSGLVFAQTGTISNGESGASVRAKLNEDITKGNAHADTLAIHLDTLQKHRIDINNNSDSVTVHRDVLDYLIENMSADGPEIDSAVVYSTGPDTIYAYYDKVVTGADDSTLYDVMIHDGFPTVYTPIVDENVVKIPMDYTVTVGVSILLQYNRPSSGGVIDIYGNRSSSQDIAVVNRVEDEPDDATLLMSLPFNYSLEDETGNYTITAAAGFAYTDNRTEGSHSAYFSQSGSYVTTPVLSELEAQHSYWFAHILWGTDDYDRTLFEVGGLKLRCNASTGIYSMWSNNGSGDSAVAYSTAAMKYGEWMGIGITVDSAAGECHFWIDAVDCDDDTIFRNDFLVKDDMRIGADKDNLFKAYSFKDIFRVYNGHLVEDDILELQNIINSTPEDTTTLRIDTAYAGQTDNTTMILSMSRQVGNETVNEDLFTYYVDDVSTVISDISISGTNLIFTIPELSGGEELWIVYDSTDVNNKLEDLREYRMGNDSVEVYNYVESTITTLAHYKVNGDFDDDLGANDATGSGSETYNTSVQIEGTSSLNNGYYGYGTTPVLALDSCFSVSWWVYSSTASGDDAYSIQVSTAVLEESSDRDGFSGGYDFIAGHPIGIFNDGTEVTVNGDAGFPNDDEWIHVVMSVNLYQGADSVCFYVNGEYAGGGSMTLNIPTDEQITIGRGRIYKQPTQSDDHQFMDSTLTLAQAEYLYLNPGDRLPSSIPTCPCGGTPPDDCWTCPEPDSIFDIMWTRDFDHWVDDGYTLPVRYRNEMVTVDFWGELLEDSESNGPPYDTIAYDPLTNDPGIKIWMMDGEYNSYSIDVPNHDGGEATRIYWDETEDLNGESYPREVYFSYNVQFNKNFNSVAGGKLFSLLGKGGRQFFGLPLGNDEGCWAGILFKGVGARSYLAAYNHDELYPDNGWVPGQENWGELQPEGVDYYGDAFTYINDLFSFDHYDGRFMWWNITQRAVMNTTGNDDGFIEFYVNGYMVLRVTGLEWQEFGWPTQGWGGFYLAFFHGGNQPNYAAEGDSYAIFDDLTIYEYLDGYFNNEIDRDYGHNDDDVVLPLPNWPKE